MKPIDIRVNYDNDNLIFTQSLKTKIPSSIDKVCVVVDNYDHRNMPLNKLQVQSTIGVLLNKNNKEVAEINYTLTDARTLNKL